MTFNFKDELELALMGQEALVAYLAALQDTFFVNNHMPPVNRSRAIDARREAYQHCNHQGCVLLRPNPLDPASPVVCQTCHRAVMP